MPYTVHATAKLLNRVDQSPGEPVAASTTMGAWYGTMLTWRPQVALLVNEPTRLPVLMALAPARSLADRFPEVLAAVLIRIGIPEALVTIERAAMAGPVWAKTSNRSVVGSMNDFASLADHHRSRLGQAPDLVDLSVRLSQTPCSPLYGSHSFPDRETQALFGVLDLTEEQ